MAQKLKDNLWGIGNIILAGILAVTLLVERWFSCNPNVVDFIRGFGCGIVIVGGIYMLIKYRKDKNTVDIGRNER